MGTISFLDSFGLEPSVSLRDSKFNQILPQFAQLGDTTLDKLLLEEAGLALTFKKPIALPLPGVALTLGAGASGHIRMLRAADHLLDREDPFSSISIASGEIYIALELEISATAGVSVDASGLTFGFKADHKLTIVNYRRFFRNDTGTYATFQEAMSRLLGSVLLPQRTEDLSRLDRDLVVVMNGTGDLNLSAAISLAGPVHQLAATSPIAGNTVTLNAGASVTAEFGITWEGAYQIRLRRQEDTRVELGVYTDRSRTLELQVSAKAGVTAGLGNVDLLEQLVAALSPNPVVDLNEFHQALPGEDEAARDLQIASFKRSLSAAIGTNLSVSLTTAMSQLSSKESALTFLFEEPLPTEGATASALTAALHGDFRPFTDQGNRLPGVQQIANVFTSTELSKQKLTLNVLGILNFVNVGKLARVSTVERNANGDVTLVTDATDANRLFAVLLNGVGSAKRLQALLSEDFLFQASFTVADLAVLPPSFSAKHTFFSIRNNTGPAEMKNVLDVCRVMGFLTAEEEGERLHAPVPGRTSFWVQTNYASDSLEHLLLNSRQEARSKNEFVRVGRTALGLLLAGDEGQEFRKVLADLGPRGNSIWKAMEAIGNPRQFNQLFGVPLSTVDPRVEAASADFQGIRNWASAMTELAGAVVEIRKLLRGSVAAEDSRLREARDELKRRMADVVKLSGEHFGEPLGLVTVFLASDETAAARVILSGPSMEPLQKELPAKPIPVGSNA